MSPRNILNNVVEGNVEQLKKAVEFFTMACRPTVGYKQIARYLDITIEVVSNTESIPTVVVPEKKPVNKYLAEAEMFRDMFINKSKRIVTSPVVKETPVLVDLFNDFDTPQVEVQPELKVEEKPVVFSLETPELLSYDDFVAEITKGILLKQTRRDDEVDIVVKAVWRKFKDRLVSKESCRHLCIEIHKAFTATMEQLPPHWFFVQSKHFISGYYQEAVNVCRPKVTP